MTDSKPGGGGGGVATLGQRRRLSFAGYHPAVGAVILSNTLRGCDQVRDMVDLCQGSPSEEHRDSSTCRTAMRYYDDSCLREGGDGRRQAGRRDRDE
jgi:hypothetical protein